MNVESSLIEAAEAATVHPPRLPFVLTVGITGHRIEALPAEAVETIIERIGKALVELKARAGELYERERACFADCPPRMAFVSPLADGADQIAADIALELGFELHAILPFAREQYRTTLHDSGLARVGFVLDHRGDRNARAAEHAGNLRHHAGSIFHVWSPLTRVC